MELDTGSPQTTTHADSGWVSFVFHYEWRIDPYWILRFQANNSPARRTGISQDCSVDGPADKCARANVVADEIEG
jgi:hypothetical protein